VERKVFVNAAESSDEMIFEGTDGALGGVAAVDAGRSFVVETLEAGTY
jgi:hypothetical protein